MLLECELNNNTNDVSWLVSFGFIFRLRFKLTQGMIYVSSLFRLIQSLGQLQVKVSLGKPRVKSGFQVSSGFSSRLRVQVNLLALRLAQCLDQLMIQVSLKLRFYLSLLCLRFRLPQGFSQLMFSVSSGLAQGQLRVKMCKPHTSSSTRSRLFSETRMKTEMRFFFPSLKNRRQLIY